ncbi:hypothetical protein OG884_15600 [Streptosporangium sp. NBC_01755]|uniref:hypothetical protein n=1 Tax=Streptosporangium sp. NBC_01755 TaxID=2975949 RepID=UPI002DD926FD|nr:hypothetical protein [Streptosporangium sp. NBC_01755]WSD03259.1 hypothetical protein OG884_15600 [Streptosporangium sp. NBC_01755]
MPDLIRVDPDARQADGLFQIITVHCFFNCGHIEHDITPQSAHDGMERHYSEKHAAEIRSILRQRIREEP